MHSLAVYVVTKLHPDGTETYICVKRTMKEASDEIEKYYERLGINTVLNPKLVIREVEL